jgi:DNA-binding CsgD family transcriptional regulator
MPLFNRERVRGLILHNCYIEAGRQASAQLEELATDNWPMFLEVTARALTLSQVPELKHRLEILKLSSTQANWLARVQAWRATSLEDLLPKLRMPVLVLAGSEGPHAGEEEGKRIASMLPDGRLVLRTSDPNGEHLVAAIRGFVEELQARSLERHGLSDHRLVNLSKSELVILHRLKAGQTNRQIAQEMVLSVNTIKAHVHHIFEKTGTANRTEAAALLVDC